MAKFLFLIQNRWERYAKAQKLTQSRRGELSSKKKAR